MAGNGQKIIGLDKQRMAVTFNEDCARNFPNAAEVGSG